MASGFHDGSRSLQDRFDTRGLADRIDDLLVSDTISDHDQAVELGHHQRVAGPAGSERLAETGALTVAAGQAVVDVDPLDLHAQAEQGVALRGQVLLID